MSLFALLALACACGSGGASSKPVAPLATGTHVATASEPTAPTRAHMVLGLCKSKGQTYADKLDDRLIATEQAEPTDYQPGPPDPPTGPTMTIVPPALLAKYARDVVQPQFARKLGLLRSCFPGAAFERLENPTIMRISMTIDTEATVVSGYATGTQLFSARQCVSSIVRGVAFTPKPPAPFRVSCELTVYAPGTAPTTPRPASTSGPRDPVTDPRVMQ